MRSCRATVTETFYALPARFDPGIQDAIETAALDLGLKPKRMPSGAFHDAQFLVPLCPSGMVFIPSRDGVSHHPSEYSTPSQIANGAALLARVLVDLAAR